MHSVRLALVALFLALFGCCARHARAQGAFDASDVNPGPHRVSAELGVFELPKQDMTGAAFGLGYGFRPISGLELGVGLRYFVQPAHPSNEFVSQPAPAPGEPTPPPQHDVDPGYHFWVFSASVRGFLSLDPARHFELGLNARGGLVRLPDRPGVCCYEGALAPDFRVRILSGTALAIAPEVAISTTGADQSKSEDYVDPIFVYGTVWLSVIQTF